MRKHMWSVAVSGHRICLRLQCYAEWFRSKAEPTSPCKGVDSVEELP